MSLGRVPGGYKGTRLRLLFCRRSTVVTFYNVTYSSVFLQNTYGVLVPYHPRGERPSEPSALQVISWFLQAEPQDFTDFPYFLYKSRGFLMLNRELEFDG